MKIVHVITSLDTGGAQVMLQQLLASMDRSRFEPTVIALTSVGPVGDRLRAMGIPTSALGMRRGVATPHMVGKLAWQLRNERPDLVQTWMHHSDLIGGMAARLAGNIPVVWGIHHTTFDPALLKRRTRLTLATCARLSSWVPARIVCCAETSRTVHAARGYDTSKMLVIPNGFDVERFQPDPAAHESVRAELGLAAETPLIGLVARFDPQKDQRNFVQAAGLLAAMRSEVHFLLCGDEIDWHNPALTEWIARAGMQQRCHLLGRRTDTPRIQAALDIGTIASYWGEAFPLVIGEAMASGVPCVVTDIGDSARLVGDTGLVVPPRDAPALAAAWQRILSLSPAERDQRGRAARQRIIEHFNLPDIADRYEQVYQEVIQAHSARYGERLPVPSRLGRSADGGVKR